MTNENFTQRIDASKQKLYKTAMLYMGSHSAAMDVLDEAIYKAWCARNKLREEAFFDTWITRILINECNNELRRQKRLYPIDELPEMAAEELDHLPLKEAIQRLPKELKDVIILRYFSGFTLVETARMLKIPQGTAASRQRKALKLLRLELEEEVTV
ncbi:MAG: sigma-70 family RNA polymerase sigma factor [Oscillospiraceae bacterium]|nr:sigma-70 family RNA polymerase sigma factor [Oscillospiraceae bacterium]